jgi:hypothetical protein
MLSDVSDIAAVCRDTVAAVPRHPRLAAPAGGGRRAGCRSAPGIRVATPGSSPRGSSRIGGAPPRPGDGAGHAAIDRRPIRPAQVPGKGEVMSLGIKMASMQGSNPSEDTPTGHGFFMLGTSSVYLYHSAQFTMENHSYQMIFTVGIPQPALATYAADVEKNAGGGWVWVFVNGIGNTPPPDQLFTLPQIQTGEVSALTGSIFRLPASGSGQQVTVVPQVTVNVERLVYFRHFDYSMSYPAPLPYVLFGDAAGAYIAHYTTRLEDFDNLAQLAAPPAWLAMDQLMAGVQIDFPHVPYEPGQLPAASPLTAGTTYPVLFGGVPDPSFAVTVASIYWFDVTIINAPA